VRGRDGIEDGIEVPMQFRERLGLRGQREVGGAQPLGIHSLSFGRTQDGDIGAHRRCNFHSHVAEPT